MNKNPILVLFKSKMELKIKPRLILYGKVKKYGMC